MIHLEDDWYIELDPNCFILQKFMGKDKKGNPIYRYQTYYATLEKAVFGYVNSAPYRVLVDKDVEFAEAVKLINEEYNRLHDIVERALTYDNK